MDKKARNAKKKGIIKSLWPYLYGSKRYFILGTIFMLTAVIASYVKPYVISFTVDYAIGGREIEDAPKFLMNWIESLGGREYLIEHLILCAAALLLCQLCYALSVHLRGRCIGTASENMAKTLRDNLYSHLQRVPYDYHKHVSTGDLIQRCTSDVETIRRFIVNQLMEVLRTVAMIIFAATIMFSMNVKMAIASTVMMPILAIISFVYFKNVKKQFQSADEAEGKLSATIQENLTGVRVVRAFGQQSAEMEKFTHDNADFKEKNYKLLKMLALYWGCTDCLGYLQIAISLFTGIYFATTQPEVFSIGNLLLFTTYTSMLTWPVRQLGRVLADLGKMSVSVERLNEIFDQEKEKEPGKALKPQIRGEIEFKDVCFGYDTYDDVLKKISFKVKPGSTIAILGSTGSGKSSLVQLLQRLYQCTSGSITIDGVDINDIESGHLRRNIGIVLQEPFLYSRNIMENIRITRPDASDEEVYEAAKVASLHDVVMSFENGYDTIVGERGVTLSGGQKQRVAIARMLMQNAPILIFDDSLSAVDTETDAAIRDALSLRKKDSTMFIISHRITTLSTADCILVLDDGKLIASGTHEELLAKDGLYKRIAHIQNQLEDELIEEGGM